MWLNIYRQYVICNSNNLKGKIIFIKKNETDDKNMIVNNTNF